MIDLQDGGETVPKYCEDDRIEAMINTAAFPNTLEDIFGKREYWSSSPYVGNSDYAWIVSFNRGDISTDLRFMSSWVRLVRASQSLGDAVALEFVTPLEKDTFAIVVKKSVEEHRIAKADEERRITQAKADEERHVAQAQAARASAIKKMVSEGAAQLYLKAGQAQRNWSISIKVGGIHFGANFLYQLIIDKFPNSEYAIKANDQLNAQQR
jgi:hypothetical protein